MAATRFYLPAEGSGVPNISPAYSASWNQTGEATRLKLLYKPSLTTLSTLADNGIRTVPITTTQNILCNQFISDPIPPQRIDASCLFSCIIRGLVSVTTGNTTLAVIVRIVSQDGGTVRGTPVSAIGVDSAFVATVATRIRAQTAVTAVTTQPGDRIVVEIGGKATAPSTSATYTMRQGDSAATDFALTSALTTDLNPWCEFSKDLYATGLNNFQFLKVGDGMSVGEKVR